MFFCKTWNLTLGTKTFQAVIKYHFDQLYVINSNIYETNEDD